MPPIRDPDGYPLYSPAGRAIISRAIGAYRRRPIRGPSAADERFDAACCRGQSVADGGRTAPRPAGARAGRRAGVAVAAAPDRRVRPRPRRVGARAARAPSRHRPRPAARAGRARKPPPAGGPARTPPTSCCSPSRTPTRWRRRRPAAAARPLLGDAVSRPARPPDAEAIRRPERGRDGAGPDRGDRPAALQRGAVRPAREHDLAPGATDAEAWCEFVAVFLQLYYFDRRRLGWFFPSVRRPADALRVIGADVDAGDLLRQTRPAGADELPYAFDRR